MAKWLSLSFDQTILRKRGGGGGLIALQFLGYLKRQLEPTNVFVRKKNIRNLRINLRNELLYSYIFIMYMSGVCPLANTLLLTQKLKFCPNSLRMTPEPERP